MPAAAPATKSFYDCELHGRWHGRRTLRVEKKAHLGRRETCVVPIFPEVEPFLRRAFDAAPDRSVHVLPARFHNEGYAYAGVLRAVERASVPTWPKLFVNLRASRETALMRTEPAHVVHAWIGNSKEVAEDHYLMVTDEDYERASAGRPIYPAQNPAQSDAVSSRQGSPRPTKKAVIPAKHEDHGLASTPTGSRTPVFGLRTRRPGPLDDGGERT